MEKNKLWYRIRGMDKMERYGENAIKNFIEKRLQTEDKIRVLEIGFGEGKCLIELRNLFPYQNLELCGINNIKKGNMHCKNDFYKNSEEFKINIPKSNLPTPFFYDVGNGLDFKNNYFDVIMSQVAIPYVGDKINLYEEIWRVLKKGGKAFLHTDSELDKNFPDFMKLKKDTPRLIIYNNNNKIISTMNYINNFRKKGFEIRMFKQKSDRKNFLLIMEKNVSKKLNFGLNYDGNSTLYLTKLKKTDQYKTDASMWWGTRSVYGFK